ncbi:MAG: permease [Myxococcota bacterium]
MSATASPPVRWRVPLAAAATLGAWGVLYTHLEDLARLTTHGLMGLERGSHLGEAATFFVYEVPKVLMLLVLIVFAVGIVRTFFTPERTRRILAGKRESAGNVLAALLGVVTPFCSCSAVPLFIGFVTAGVPLGVTFSFLIAAPMVNEVALVLLFGLVGWQVALLYAVTGLAVAIVAGWVLGRMNLERHVESWVYDTPGAGAEAGAGASEEHLTWGDRGRAGLDAVREIVGRVWLYVVGGIAVGAAIHGYVPEDFMASVMGESAWWSVPAAVLLGVPMYSNAAGVVPVVQALLEKGAALGTTLAFMMAVIALSLPEVVILRKVLRPRLIAAFLGVVAAGILLVGYLFNVLV